MKNTESHYGWLTIAIHWLVAIVVIGLFALGAWMVGLGYYDPWYKQGPDIHKSIGVLLFITMLLRLAMRWFQEKPQALDSHTLLEQRIGTVVHISLYVLLFTIMTSGYLISTADDRAIEVFQWFTVPSLGELFEGQEDIAGEIHEYLAYFLMALVSLHALAALKHHFVDKDNTLKRMLGHRKN